MLIIFTIELNILPPCFELSALYLRICCNRWPSPPAWHPSTLVLAWYCTYGRGQLGSIRLKTSRLPDFSFLAVLILCLQCTVYGTPHIFVPVSEFPPQYWKKEAPRKGMLWWRHLHCLHLSPPFPELLKYNTEIFPKVLFLHIQSTIIISVL